MSNLVGIKNILTYKLINSIKPFIYEGLLSVYLDATNISEPENVLMVFQGLLSRIPKWSENDLIKEVNRIKSNSKCIYLDNLLKSLIKINISIFLEETKDTFVDPSLYEKINLKDFIHKTYILVARNVFNNPILFYKELKDIEVLNNMNMVMKIIEKEIENSIIELLPLDYLIDEFLNVEVYDQQIKLKIPNESIENLKQLQNKINMIDPIDDIRVKLVNNNQMENRVDPNQFPIVPVDGKQLFPVQQQGGNHNISKGDSRGMSSSDSRRRSSSDSRKRSDSDSRRRFTSSSRGGGRGRSSSRGGGRGRSRSRSRSRSRRRRMSSEELQKNVKKFLSNSKNESEKIDNIIKNKHFEAQNINNKNVESSFSYNVDNADKYEEIFSNDKEIKYQKKPFKKPTVGNNKDSDIFTNNNSVKKLTRNKNYRALHKI